jgi:hypothetical protein
MSTRAGKPNYKNKILLEIIKAIRPVSSEQWMIVVERYKDKSGEIEMRDVQQLKKHFTSKMCNGHKKITGKAKHKLLIEQSQLVYKELLRKECGVAVGGNSDDDVEEDEEELDDDDDDQDDDNDEDFEEEKDGGFGKAEKLVKSTSSSPRRPTVDNEREETVSTKRKSDVIGKTKSSRNVKRGTIANSVESLVSEMKERSSGSSGSSQMIMFMMMQQQQQEAEKRERKREKKFKKELKKLKRVNRAQAEQLRGVGFINQQLIDEPEDSSSSDSS